MSLSDFFLICFGVGLVLSIVFLISGTFHLHLPGKYAGHHVGGQAGGRHTTGAQGNNANAPSQGASKGSSRGVMSELAHVSPFNLFTAMAFLTWFGGSGYLLTRYYAIVGLLAIALATGLGMVGAAVVFIPLAKIMVRGDRPLRDEDFEMVGVIGRVSSVIRPEGIGEIVFSQAGTRRHCGARSGSGEAVERGTEVVVTQFERGIAYVRPWNEFAQEHSLDAEEGVQQ